MSNPTFPPTIETLWFYADVNNQPVGPLPFVELQRLAAAGVIHAGTHVIEEGGSDWRRLCDEIAPGSGAPQSVAPSAALPFREPKADSIRWLRTLALFLLWPAGLWMLFRNDGFRRKERIAFLVLFWPAGLCALWRASAGFSGHGKLAARVFVAGFASLVVLGALTSPPKEESTPPVQASITEAELPKKPKIFRSGVKVVVAKGSTVYGDAELLAQFSKARRENDKTGIKAASAKMVGKTGNVGENSVFTVIEAIEDGVFYKLEGTTGDGQRQTWCAAYANMSPYVSPGEAKARAELAAAETQLSKDRAEIERIARKQFHDKLSRVEVNRILSGPSEGLYNVEVRFSEGENWSAKWQKRSIEMEMRETYEKLFTSGPRVWEVWCFVEAGLIDQFGQERKDVVYKTSMTKTVADKINWKNKALLDFTNLWETHQLHPALTRE